MAKHVISADGTRIAYDVRGSGDSLVLIGGLLCDRIALADLAEVLARERRVITYDRRGRGDSGDTPPYGVARELEDLGALIAAAGGAAAVYGHSSGAGLALNAAAHGLSVTRLVLHEPPYSAGDDESRCAARELAESVRAALAAGRRQEAIRLFCAAAGMPDDISKEFCGDPKRRALAHTMTYDFEVMGEFAGGGIPEHLVRAISIPTLVVAGDASPDFFRDIATRITSLLPNGQFAALAGQDHGAGADVVAAVIAKFLAVKERRCGS
jgi:pimeloyl-ACP methyl ester carboxylesterase